MYKVQLRYNNTDPSVNYEEILTAKCNRFFDKYILSKEQVPGNLHYHAYGEGKFHPNTIRTNIDRTLPNRATTRSVSLAKKPDKILPYVCKGKDYVAHKNYTVDQLNVQAAKWLPDAEYKRQRSTQYSRVITELRPVVSALDEDRRFNYEFIVQLVHDHYIENQYPVIFRNMKAVINTLWGNYNQHDSLLRLKKYLGC